MPCNRTVTEFMTMLSPSSTVGLPDTSADNAGVAVMRIQTIDSRICTGTSGAGGMW